MTLKKTRILKQDEKPVVDVALDADSMTLKKTRILKHYDVNGIRSRCI